MPIFPGAQNQALFLYGMDITQTNNLINFKSSSGGSILTATLNIGNYTATQFMAEIVRAMTVADPSNTYTVGLNRSVSGGLSNAMTVSTSGSFLSLLFGTGPSAANSPASLMGFNSIDYTGHTSYTAVNNAGIILVPKYPTWNYQGPNELVQNDGIRNVSAAGIKETLVFAQMQFFQGEWRYITDINGEGQYTAWVNFLKYAIKQLQFEFTPSIYEDPDTFYQCTLESTQADSNGLQYSLEQMNKVGLFRQYQTNSMKFRVVITD